MSSSSSSIKNMPRKGVVNVYGPRGCGKSTFFSTIKHVNMDHDILKTKESTLHFMETMRYSLMPLVLDDFDYVSSCPGVKELQYPIRTAFFIVSVEKLKLDFITDWFEFPGVSVDDFAKLHSITVDRAKEVIDRVGGNMTSASVDVTNNFESKRDLFIDSKEYIKRIIETPSKCEFIDRFLTEHGNTLGIMHENYTDYSSSTTAQISHSLSEADLIDSYIYSEMSWDLMPFFNVSACVVPGSLCKGPVTKELRPGSVWTKHSNMLMKAGRLKKLRMNREYIELLVLKANNGDPLEEITDTYDLDSINQLSFTKIKPRILTSLKKKCRESK